MKYLLVLRQLEVFLRKFVRVPARMLFNFGLRRLENVGTRCHHNQRVHHLQRRLIALVINGDSYVVHDLE